MTVGDCGARRPLLGIVGQFGWRTGRDGKRSSVLVRTQDGRTGRLGTLFPFFNLPFGFHDSGVGGGGVQLSWPKCFLFLDAGLILWAC